MRQLLFLPNAVAARRRRRYSVFVLNNIDPRIADI